MPLIEERTTGPTLTNRPDGAGWSTPFAANASPASATPTPTSGDNLTSSTNRADVARNAGVFLGALISVAFGIAAIGLSRVGRQLRRPDKDEVRDIARPLARIAVRHIPADMITADLADLGEAGAAVERYVAAGPVAPRVVAVEHIGMPTADGPDNPAPVTPAAPDAATIWHDATQLDQQPTALVDQGPRPRIEYAQ